MKNLGILFLGLVLCVAPSAHAVPTLPYLVTPELALGEPADPQLILQTNQAINTGYSLFETHLQAKTLTANEQKIYAWLSNDELLNSLLATLLANHWKPNRPDSIRLGVKALQENEQIKELTQLLLKNQTFVPIRSVDFQRAQSLVAAMIITTFTKLLEE